MAQKKNPDPNSRSVAENRKARFNYEILDTLEAGIVLQGTEVKSLREGRTNIAESYAGESGGELWLYNVHIPEYGQANRFNHELRRPRKLLLHRREMHKLFGAIQQDGMTLVPLRMYFNKRGMAKVLLGVAKGKKTHDKRETAKKRDWQRDKQRLLRERG
ncbi:MAG: SsrA-binding protein SmpB [Pseudomonadota bacterium]